MRLLQLAAAVVLVLLSTAAEATLPPAMVLERSPLNGVLLGQLMEMDRARHAKASVVNFSVEGNVSPLIKGLYYTTVKLGNPSKKYTFTIDTGSSIPWVACRGCTSCSTKKISMELYNPDSSSTSSRISCSSHSCKDADDSGSGVCETFDSNRRMCGFDLTYGDQTKVSGYYVSDNMYYDTIARNKSSANSSASLIFGCTNSLSHMMETDGLLGFGQDPLSLIPQLNSQGVSPKAFSHCLKGSEDGGGTLVLGKIVAPGLVFSPLVPAQSLYYLNLEGIAVNGRKLPIDSSLFATSDSQGTLVDSGTTLAYIVDGAHGPLISAIDAATSPSVGSWDVPENGKRSKCYMTSGSIDLLFPTATLYFKGGVAMTLKPSQYLLNQGGKGNDTIWCTALISSDELHDMQGTTILGDVVLHDKLIVYDLGKHRLGWTDYNCSSLDRTSPVDVSGASSCYSSVNCLIAIVVAVVLGELIRVVS